MTTGTATKTRQISGSGCETCPMHNVGNLTKLGIDMTDWDYVIGLAGNPNVGKSTIFNALTGLRQHTGNWPGKTVTRAEGGFEYDSRRYKLVDLPGTYSLLSTSLDEEVARNFILFGQPDVTLIVADATRLERNLNLVLQVLEITDRAVLALNLMDEAKRHGLSVDARSLARDLGIPVVPTSARSRQGMDELVQAMSQVATGQFICKPHRLKSEPPALRNSLNELAVMLTETFPGLPNARWVAMRLLDGDQGIMDALQRGELGDLTRDDPGKTTGHLVFDLEAAPI